MKGKRIAAFLGLSGVAILAVTTLLTSRVLAHCDTMDGPVIKTARMALEKGDVTPALKWVSKDNEAEVRTSFEKTLAVRKQGKDARELADTYFFETLVRLHRAGEGAPYTGLKPHGTPLEPGVAEADQALDSGKMDGLIAVVSAHLSDGIRERFNRAVELKKHQNQGVEAGREYIEAYVSYVHYVENLMAAAAGAGGEEH